MDVSRIKANSDYLLVRKCFKDHIRDKDGKVVIFRTDNDMDLTNFVTILSVGPNCELFDQSCVGAKALSPEWVTGMHDIGEDLYFIREPALANLCAAVWR